MELQDTLKACINLLMLYKPGEWRFFPSWIQILLLVALNILHINKLEAEFNEFEPRLKFKPWLKYG